MRPVVLPAQSDPGHPLVDESSLLPSADMIGMIDPASADKTIDAHGLTVAPGFIDMLGQSELTILVNPHLPS